MMDSKINFHVGIIWLQLPESKFILYFQLEKHLMVFIWDAVVREKCEGWLLMSLIPEANVESQGTWWKHNRRLRMTGIKHFLRLCIWLRLGTWTRKTEKENRLWKKQQQHQLKLECFSTKCWLSCATWRSSITSSKTWPLPSGHMHIYWQTQYYDFSVKAGLSLI